MLNKHKHLFWHKFGVARDKILRSSFVTEGTMVAFPPCFLIDAVAGGLGALVMKNAARATALAGIVWIAASIAWWIADWPNLWGPEPTIGLPISQTVAALLVLGKFYGSRRVSPDAVAASGRESRPARPSR